MDVEVEDDNYDDILFFGAHVPHLLLQRCIKSIYNKKICPNQLQPFIERLEGSLLFVDISGFTALSRLLHVESLKTQINAYFTDMLDVIDRFGGDVIKFAGDALYIVWSATGLNNLESCVEKGFLCSIAIRNKCNNYAVCLGSASTTSPSSKENVVYMNVHCALSVGVIAAVDVGCSGRWELLLLGYY